MTGRTERIILGTLFLLAIYFPIFLHLDQVGIYLWDEANNVLQAYEMSENGHYLRRYFLGDPDNWESKPPLLVWLQMISMKIFGFNELGARLPSALATLATVFLILRFFYKELNFFIGGIISSLILLTSSGYVRGHVSRTADHDALLILFLMGGLISWYKYLKHEEHKPKYLILFTICFIGGVMTKSIAGLFFGPALLLFTIVDKKLLITLKDKGFWIAVACFVAVIGGFYGLVELYYPGYIKVIWENELFPRFFDTAKTYDYNDMPEPFYYVKEMITEHFKWYYLFVPISLVLVFLQKDNELKRFIILTGLSAFLFILIISKGTYNSWYSAPAFPLLAMITGSGIGLIYRSLKQYLDLSRPLWHICFSVLFLTTVFYKPYESIILEQCYFPMQHDHDPKYGDFLNRLRKDQPGLKDLFIYYEPLNRHFLFYESVFNDQYGYNIKSCGPGNSIRNCKPGQHAQVGDHLIVCNKKFKEEVLELFEVQVLREYQECKLYLVLSRIEPEPDE